MNEPFVLEYNRNILKIPYINGSEPFVTMDCQTYFVSVADPQKERERIAPMFLLTGHKRRLKEDCFTACDLVM